MERSQVTQLLQQSPKEHGRSSACSPSWNWHGFCHWGCHRLETKGSCSPFPNGEGWSREHTPGKGRLKEEYGQGRGGG